MAFVLDTDILGGSDFNFVEAPFGDRGRSIMIEWSQGGSDQDMELFGYSIRYFPAEAEARQGS